MTTPSTPAGPSTSVQYSFICWISVAALAVLNLVVLLSQGASSLGAYLALALALVAVAGALQMRSGQARGRVIAAVAGGILAVLQLLGLILIIAGNLGIIPMVVQLIVLALVILGLVMMFRPDATASLH